MLPQLLPEESNGHQWNTSLWPVYGTTVVEQSWEPAGDSEGLCWVASGMVLAQQMSPP